MTQSAHHKVGTLDAADTPLHGLFLRMPIAILICDRHGRIAAVNDAYVALFSRNPVAGIDLLSDPVSVSRGLDRLVRLCFEGESSMSAECVYDPHPERGPARPITVAVEALPLFDGSIMISHAALVFHDRTHGANVADPAIARLAAALPRLSHDLRGPLNVILGFAEILYERQVEPDSPMHTEFLADIVASGRRMLELVNEFDAATRTRTGPPPDGEP